MIKLLVNNNKRENTHIYTVVINPFMVIYYLIKITQNYFTTKDRFPFHPKFKIMSLRNRRVNDGVTRMFFFLTFFSAVGLVVYFTLGHIYGYGGNTDNNNKNPIIISKPKDVSKPNNLEPFSTRLNPVGIPRLYPRSIEEDHREFLLIVFGWRRKDSLERLVNSLLKSDYLGKNVQLQFHIEYEPSKEVKEFVESVQWPFGTKIIIWRNEKFGLERMVVDSWDASNDNQFAFFFEDDIEVNSHYFKFAIGALDRKEIIENASIVGVALNTPRYDEVNEQHSIWFPGLEIDEDDKLFLFQQPCSWGALYFPWKWREYLEYYNKRRRGPSMANTAEGIEVIPKSCVFNWTRSWKKYFMELMVLKGYVMIYPSLPDQESLSVHHREEGEHTGIINKYLNKVVDYFVVPLASQSNAQVLIESLRQVDINQLPVISFYHFRVKSIEKLKEFGMVVKRRR